MTTFRSKILLVVLGLMFAAPAMAQEASKYTPEKLALAKAYVATVPVEAEIKMAIDSMAEQVPPEQRVLFKQLGEKSIDYNRLRAAAELAVAEVFTDEEIKGMTEFYQSPTGKAVRTKMPQYDMLMQPVMTEVMTDFIKRLQENNVLPQAPAKPQ